jgi:hemicentin
VPPSIDESNVVYTIRVVENRTVILECPVSGIPAPAVDWLVNNDPLTPSERVFAGRNQQLEIHSAGVADSATYTCLASNEAGELQKNFVLEVLGEWGPVFFCLLVF